MRVKLAWPVGKVEFHLCERSAQATQLTRDSLGGNAHAIVMSSSTSLPAPSPRRPSLRTRFLALAAPDVFSEPLVQAQFAIELARNEQLQLEPDARKAEFLASLRQATVERLRRIRRTLLVSSLSTASALFVAYVFRATAIAPMLPRPVLAVGTILSFAAAPVAYLVSRRKPKQTDATSSGPRLFHVLYWIGVCWAALAIW
jgi:hypothetical protein